MAKRRRGGPPRSSRRGAYRSPGPRRGRPGARKPTAPPAPPHEDSPEAAERRGRFLVVGVGASAGGLEAMERFFRAVPADSGMAFVVVQHLDPDHRSLLHDTLARYCTMPVVPAAEGMPVQPNTTYVIPPKRHAPHLPWGAAGPQAGGTARPALAHQRLPHLPGRGPGRGRGGDHPLRQRQRRDPGSLGAEAARRPHHGAGATGREVRQHAPQRHLQRARRHGAPRRGAAGGPGRVRQALRRGRPAGPGRGRGREVGARQDRRDPLPPDRPRLQPLQEEHPRPPGAAADANDRLGRGGGLHPEAAGRLGRAPQPLPRPADRRDPVLPRPGGVRHAGGGGHPGALPGSRSRRGDPGLGGGLRHRRGGLLGRHAGASGLEKARAFRPEIVLCDLGLPGELDGYAVARAFRAEPALRSTPVLALSGYAAEEDRRRALDAGFMDHVQKPASLDALHALFDRYAP